VDSLARGFAIIAALAWTAVACIMLGGLLMVIQATRSPWGVYGYARFFSGGLGFLGFVIVVVGLVLVVVGRLLIGS